MNSEVIVAEVPPEWGDAKIDLTDADLLIRGATATVTYDSAVSRGGDCYDARTGLRLLGLAALAALAVARARDDLAHLFVTLPAHDVAAAMQVARHHVGLTDIIAQARTWAVKEAVRHHVDRMAAAEDDRQVLYEAVIHLAALGDRGGAADPGGMGYRLLPQAVTDRIVHLAGPIYRAGNVPTKWWGLYRLHAPASRAWDAAFAAAREALLDDPLLDDPCDVLARAVALGLEEARAGLRVLEMRRVRDAARRHGAWLRAAATAAA